MVDVNLSRSTKRWAKSMESKPEVPTDGIRLDLPSEHEGSDNINKEPPEMDIDPENEVKGVKLLLIHTGICLCTFLIGLVSLAKDHPCFGELPDLIIFLKKDFNLIATAIPVITSEFHSLSDVGWYGSAFYITL